MNIFMLPVTPDQEAGQTREIKCNYIPSRTLEQIGSVLASRFGKDVFLSSTNRAWELGVEKCRKESSAEHIYNASEIDWQGGLPQTFMYNLSVDVNDTSGKCIGRGSLIVHIDTADSSNDRVGEILPCSFVAD